MPTLRNWMREGSPGSARTECGKNHAPGIRNHWRLGPQCGVFDFNVIIEANDLCNRLGMDTISVSGGIAFVFEAVSKGIIKNPESGAKLEWGNGEGVISLIHQIASGEGLGS